MNIYKVTKTFIGHAKWILSNCDIIKYTMDGYHSIFTGNKFTPIYAYDCTTIIGFMK